LIKLDIIEFKSFNLKSQLNLLAEDGRLVAIVRVINFDCSLHQVYDFYILLIYDDKNNKVLSLDLINIEFWDETYALFYIFS
jgi:hypothetical protein